jgi:tetratricopeptide (TPR) repeat protein
MTSRCIPILAAAFGLLAAGCGGAAGTVSRIVIVTFDTTRADRIGCYGYADASTPNLDRFAEQSVLFEQAVSPIATTLPSHSTMFTGLLPQDHGVRYNLMYRLDAEAQTLAEVLRNGGYATAAFPASFILDEKFGLDQGFDLYVQPPAGKESDSDEPEAIYRLAAEGVDQALDWLGQQESDGRSFLWLHFYDPHVPYNPPFPFSSQFRDRPYDGEIAYADAQFGRLLDALREDPEWERTLLIVAGDHGEGLHEHGERWHSLLLYQTTQHVPLMIRAPGVGASREAEPVQLADLMPTVLDLAGVEDPGSHRGISLRPALEGRNLPPRELYFESLAGALNYGWLELKGVRDGQWKLIDSVDPELYNLAEDPGELLNVAHLEPELVHELRTTLGEVAEPLTSASLASEAQDPVLDPQTEAFLNSLGYVGGGAGGSRSEGAPHPRDVVDLEAEILTGRRAITARRWDAVEETCRYIMSRDPGNKWALNNLVTALILTDRASEAQDEAAEFVRLYPEAPQAYVALAKSYRAQDQAATAHEVLHQGLQALPGNEWLSYLALVAGFDAGLPGICPDEVDSVAQQFQKSPRVTLLVARCQALDGDFEELVLLPDFEALLDYEEAKKQERPPAP